MRKAPTILMSMVAFAAAGVAYADLSGGLGERRAGARASAARHRVSGLHLSGHVMGLGLRRRRGVARAAVLYPGARTTLVVMVRNRFRFTVRVRSISAKAASAGRGCPGKYVRVQRLDDDSTIAPDGLIRANLRIAMSREAPDACQGKKFPLRFTARATR
jgi:hypothetical protein